MDRPLQVIVALLVTTASAAAQGAAPVAQSADTSSIILAPRPAASPSSPTPSPGTIDRPVSSGIAAEIASKMPAYTPAVSAAKSGGPEVDLRDLEKPKNQIPRLPVQMMQRYVVHAARVPEFRPRDLYTKAGLIDMSFKEHPGLRIGNFFNLNAPAAYERIINEQLFAARQDLVDTVIAMANGGDEEEAVLMQQDIIDASFSSGWQQGSVGIK